MGSIFFLIFNFTVVKNLLNIGDIYDYDEVND